MTAPTLRVANITIPNAGFELPVLTSPPYMFAPIAGADWTFGGSSGLIVGGDVLGQSYPPAPEGIQVAFLQDATGVVTQTLSGFVAGATYNVRFKACQQNPGNTEDVDVSLDAILLGNAKPAGLTIEQFEFPFTAAQSTYTLKIEAKNRFPVTGNTLYLDDVEIIGVSDPVGGGGADTLFTVNAASPQATGLIGWFAGADPTDPTVLFDSSVLANHGTDTFVNAMTYENSIHGRDHVMLIANGWAVPNAGPCQALLPPFTVTGWTLTAFDRSGSTQLSLVLPFGAGWNTFFHSCQVSSNLATAINAVFTTTGNAGWSLSTWHHWALRFNATNSREYFYDGVKIPPSDTADQPLSCYLDLGGGNQVAPNGLYGYLDDVRVYNHALTDAEIADSANPSKRLLLYKSVDTLANGLTHYWKLDEVGTAARADSKGTNHLSVVGTSVNGVGKLLNSFDSNNGVSFLQGANLDLSNKSFTLAGWVQPYGYDTTNNGDVWLCSQGDGGGGTNCFDFRYTTGSLVSVPGQRGARFGWGPSFQNEIALVFTPDISGTVWSFCCVRYDLATQTMRMRINGTDATPQVGVPALTNSGLPLWVGYLQYGGNGYTNRSRVDELAVWDRSISDAELTSFQNAPGLPISAAPKRALSVGFFSH